MEQVFQELTDVAGTIRPGLHTRPLPVILLELALVHHTVGQHQMSLAFAPSLDELPFIPGPAGKLIDTPAIEAITGRAAGLRTGMQDMRHEQEDAEDHKQED